MSDEDQVLPPGMDPEDAQDVFLWNSICQSEAWKTVELWARLKLQQNITTRLDTSQDERVSLKAVGRVEAWSEVVNLRENYERLYEQLKAAQALAAQPEAEELVGATLEEQWYDKGEKP